MFEIFAFIFENIIKKSVTAVVKRATKFMKNPLKALKRKMKPIKNIKRSIVRKKKLGERIKRATKNTPKANRMGKLMEKARLIEQLTQTQAEILRGKSSAVVDTPENVKEINKTVGFLKGKSKSELDTMEETLNKSLLDLGWEYDVDENKEISEGEIYEKASEKGFDTFMDNWKNAFFAYDVEDLGMSEDERDEVWKEIEETKTYDWFVMNKLDVFGNGGKDFKDAVPQTIKL